MFLPLKRRVSLCLITGRIIHLENKNEENNSSSLGLYLEEALYCSKMKFYEVDEHYLKGACLLYWKKEPWEWPGNEGMAHIPFLLTARFQPSGRKKKKTKNEKQTKGCRWIVSLEQRNPPRVLNYCQDYKGIILPPSLQIFTLQILYYLPKPKKFKTQR